VKLDVQLPAIFTDCNVCELAAHVLRSVRTPPRTIGSSWRSTTLSAMQSRVLSLRVDGNLHSFEEARGNVRYLGDDPAHAPHLLRCTPRLIAVRRIVTKLAITLILVDESVGRPIGVIGESLAWDLDGLDVRLAIGRDEVAV
jgi:hypothetical protein